MREAGASTALQCAWRAKGARAELRERRARRDAATRLASVWRMSRGRRVVARLRELRADRERRVAASLRVLRQRNLLASLNSLRAHAGRMRAAKAMAALAPVALESTALLHPFEDRTRTAHGAMCGSVLAALAVAACLLEVTESTCACSGLALPHRGDPQPATPPPTGRGSSKGRRMWLTADRQCYSSTYCSSTYT